MPFRIRRILCAVCCLVLCAGCASGKKHKKVTPPAHRVVGTITLVNEAGKFALIDADPSVPLQDGIALKSFSGDKETGVLTLSPERRPPFAIADIVAGNPQKGDKVME